jgi:hypothetical protein
MLRRHRAFDRAARTACRGMSEICGRWGCAMTRDMIDEARAVPIAEVAGVELRRVGGELVGPCPVCGGHDRFGVSVRKNVWNCRQCEIGGDVIALAMHVYGIDFRGAVELLTGGKATASPPKHQMPPGETPLDDARIMASVERIWTEAVPIVGTPGEDWLVGRGIVGRRSGSWRPALPPALSLWTRSGHAVHLGAVH